ncbi:hypothetical protein [Campylobacter sp. RM16192]|uniref:hypothetical protein n=1 Tax=Campylobacter sp. RM16192 TaxID=1660080 RepID=UPI001451D68F|nr:hypothetical protein [Campylobacter sp. RM16192]QCD52734.1 hypothetical protein CDOMC_1116 [Campylobacter sp. RM16192]
MKTYIHSKIKNIIFFTICIFFIGCVDKFRSPDLPKFDSVMFEIITESGLKKLYVSHIDENYNFTMLDSLGTPLARRVLKSDGKFESIGFLPPKKAYNELFVKVLDMIEFNNSKSMFLIDNENFKVRIVDIYK